MILKHVAEDTGRVIEAGPMADVDGFGHRDLDVVDVIAVPQWLENGISETEEQDVLRRFLAEIVVDPVDLTLIEYGVHGSIQGLSRGEIRAKRFLDDHPSPTPGLADHSAGAQ